MNIHEVSTQCQNCLRTLKYKRCSSLQASEATRPPLQILVVEDDLSLLKLYEIVLGNWAMAPAVTVAANGLTGLLWMAHRCPDILILDMHLPDMDGLAMARQVRADARLQSTTVVLVSGTSIEDVDMRGGLPADAVYMRKPVDFSQLKEVAVSVSKKLLVDRKAARLGACPRIDRARVARTSHAELH